MFYADNTYDLLSIIAVSCSFLILIIVLFFDEQDYLSFSVLLMLISGIVSSINIEAARDLKQYVEAIEWEVIFFLIAMFVIVEILNEAKIFHAIAYQIVSRFRHNIRFMFYAICITSTLSAAIIEDLSVAIIFIPIIILACREIQVSPTPFLLGMTICINLASTLTPFGSPENIIIAIEFNLSFWDFLTQLGIYFIVTTAITLFLLDKLILSKVLKIKNSVLCEEPNNLISNHQSSDSIHDLSFDPIVLRKNLIGLFVFICLLIFIDQIYLVGLIGMVIFVFLNTKKDKKGFPHPQLSKYLSKIEYKLIYFFMCLFVLVHLMELNGTVDFIDDVFNQFNDSNQFWLAVVILITTSILSGFIDNAPVTVMFLPIINYLNGEAVGLSPLLIAFILGINLGGNFLPQGSACDMMTLELSRQNCIKDLDYKRLTKVGGLFALLHVLIGIVYLAILIFVF